MIYLKDYTKLKNVDFVKYIKEMTTEELLELLIREPTILADSFYDRFAGVIRDRFDELHTPKSKEPAKTTKNQEDK